MAIECEIDLCQVAAPDSGKLVTGISATCGHCDLCIEIPGDPDSPADVRRAMHKLNDECPHGYTKHVVVD